MNAFTRERERLFKEALADSQKAHRIARNFIQLACDHTPLGDHIINLLAARAEGLQKVLDSRRPENMQS